MPDEEKSIIEPTNPDVAEVEVKEEVATQAEETTKEAESPDVEVAEEKEVKEVKKVRKLKEKVKVEAAEPETAAETAPSDGESADEEETEDLPKEEYVAPTDPPITNDEIRTVTVEELEKMVAENAPDNSDLEKYYNDSLNDISEGDVTEGRVLAVNDNEAIVDIGFKSEGIVPIEDFKRDELPEVGDTIEVYLERLEDENGQLVLSKKKADFMRIWERIVEGFNNDEIFEGRILRRVKGGMIVDLLGLDAFLPGSQIDIKPIQDFDQFVGNKFEFKIVKLNEARKNIVVSRRELIEEDMKEKRQEVLSGIEQGQVMKGRVKNITDFGVFVDLGGVDGLLHITDLSWGRVNHPSEVVSIDEEIEVTILNYNQETDRISLGYKQLQPHPWEGIEDRFPVDSVIKGKVVSITNYGAFVELEKGVEGLIHISEMSWTQHIRHPSNILSLGGEVEAKVLKILPEEKKISLGLKQLTPDPWENIEEKYQVSTIHSGVVRNLTQFGAFVEMEEGVEGLVHISDLSWTKKVRHPKEIVKKADEIEVMVLDISRENRRISLGVKQVSEDPWPLLEEKFGLDQHTDGTITKVLDKGVTVDLPEGAEGFVPLSKLTNHKVRRAAEIVEEGDELKLKVIEFSKEEKKIILSYVDYLSDSGEEEPADRLEKAQQKRAENAEAAVAAEVGEEAAVAKDADESGSDDPEIVEDSEESAEEDSDSEEKSEDNSENVAEEEAKEDSDSEEKSEDSEETAEEEEKESDSDEDDKESE
ncbi:MAG: 30S ribosomal protein S1 [Candidatus Marinimicrobia bacterium]|nr:30S ribosomal protein S1 [Candidatus Neomarinimicrobiota bacterium]